MLEIASVASLSRNDMVASGGRVGLGVLPRPYRDHYIVCLLVIDGLDMPFAIAQGYSTTSI